MKVGYCYFMYLSLGSECYVFLSLFCSLDYTVAHDFVFLELAWKILAKILQSACFVGGVLSSCFVFISEVNVLSWYSKACQGRM